MNSSLFAYIRACPTAYHAAAHTAAILTQAGYQSLSEGSDWQLAPGGKYFVIRGGSSLIAFRIPLGDFSGYMLTAAHGDSPSFKLKNPPDLSGGGYARLSAEPYGGSIFSSWMDRPLSIAGRVLVRRGNSLTSQLVNLQTPVALIPHVAIHMNRKVNESATFNPAVDLVPLYRLADGSEPLSQLIAQCAGAEEEDLLSSDLFLYNPQDGVSWNDLISAPRLDDLQCAFAALTAFLRAGEQENLPLYCLFDHEEVGSRTQQGAGSTFLPDTLERIRAALGLRSPQHLRKLASSLLLSCDNAHAVHPNHPEYADKNHAPVMNGGVVLKHNASQKYTTDAVSAGLFQLICQAAGVPVQHYANRADLPGGSTLGNIANTQVSLCSVDIGLAQLAMHSAFETAGGRDTQFLVQALTAFYETCLFVQPDGRCVLTGPHFSCR